MSSSNKRYPLLSFIVFILLIFFYSAVDNELTIEDQRYIKDHYINLPKIAPYKLSYPNQLEIIKQIQKSVFKVAPKHIGIPKRQKREPKDLFEQKIGQCFDRSRVIEKVLRYYGFKTRHIALYSIQKTGSIFRSLITPGIASHAFSEVYTSKGWLVVDSNHEWLALDRESNPFSIRDIRHNKPNVINRLKEVLPSFIYKEDFFYVYGLYSRHGMFYPPYNYIPDINYVEFLDNIW